MLLTGMTSGLVWEPWNSLFFVSCPTYPVNFMNMFTRFLCNVASKHGSRRYINGFWTQWVKRNIPICSIISLSDIPASWKFQEDPFTRFNKMLPKDMHFPKKMQTILVCKGFLVTPPTISDCFLYHTRPILKKSWKSDHALFCNNANRQSGQPTDR